MRDINITGGNVTINIFDGCTIETIRFNGGGHTHNYGQEPCSQDLMAMLTIIARMLKGEKSESLINVKNGTTVLKNRNI